MVGIGVTIISLAVIGECLFLFSRPGLGPHLWSSPTGAFEIEAFDGDPGPAENYSNENLVIRFHVSEGTIKMVGDPDRGITIDVWNLTRDWGPFFADVREQENYEPGYVEENGYWTVSDTQNTYVRWRLHVPITTEGRLENGVTAYLYLWADTDNDETNGYGPNYTPVVTLWDIGDTMKVVIQHWKGTLLTTSDENTIYGVNLK